MLYRKITKDIQEWYQNSSTGLLVDGARQIGKTTSIRDFLVTNNISFIELNLLENKLALEAFNTAIGEKDLLFRLSSLSNKELILIIFGFLLFVFLNKLADQVKK